MHYLLEFISGYVLYGVLGQTRCWDYNQEILNFGNIGGYVCLRSVTVFGMCGLLLIYVILPLLIKLAKKVNTNVLLVISVILCTIFLSDEIYNLVVTKLLNTPKASYFYKAMGWKYLYFK